MHLYFKWPRRHHHTQELVFAAFLGATSNSKLKHLFGSKWNSGDVLKCLADIHLPVGMLNKLPNLTWASM